MTADRAAREGLAYAMLRHEYPSAAEILVPLNDQPADVRDHWLGKADALIAGPLSDFLTAAEARAERMEAERDEADRRAGAAERLLDDERDTTRKRNRWLREAKERAGYHDDVSFDTVWAETLAKAERVPTLEAATVRLTADVEALRKALVLLLPFVDFAAGEGLHFVPDPDDEAGSMDAADLCEAAAKALGCELGDPDYVALLSAGHEAIRTLTPTDQPEGTGSPAAAQEGQSAIARTETDGGRNAK